MSFVSEWSAADVAARLSGKGKARARRAGRGWKVCCPAHDDRTPSLSLNDGNNGLLWHCFGGCDSKDVYAKLREILGGEAAPERSSGQGSKKREQIVDPFTPIIPVPDDVHVTIDDFYDNLHGAPSRLWTYRTADGKIYGWVARYDLGDGEKEVIPWLWGHDSEKRRDLLRKKGFPAPRPLYNLARIVAEPDKPVLYCEGEKAADAAEAIFPDWIPTTNPGGTNAWQMADLRVLAGRTVILAPDHDGAGYNLILNLTELRQLPGTQLRMLRWPVHVTPDGPGLADRPYAMEKGDDIADHAKAGWTRELLREAMRTAGHPLTERIVTLGMPFEPIVYD